MAVKKKQQYLDNVKFFQAMKEHKTRSLAAVAEGKSPRVPLDNYVGKCIFDICKNLSLRPNFIGYSYRDEMVSDAIETCVSNAHHFNPNAVTRSGTPNPFSYFTLIAWRAMIHRIKNEKKQEYVKYKYTENQVLMGDIVDATVADSKSFDGANVVDLGTDYYVKLAKQFEKEKVEKVEGLEKFVEEDGEGGI